MSTCRRASASTRRRPPVPAGDLRNERLGLPARIEGRRKRGHRLAPLGVPIAADPAASPKSRSTTSNPPIGEPARFGLNSPATKSSSKPSVDWDGDYHEGFTIDVPELPSRPLRRHVLKNRLVFNGRSGDGTFITTPTTCFDREPNRRTRTSTRPTCSPAPTQEREEPGYSFPASAEPRARVAAAGTAKSRSTANTSPTNRRIASNRTRPKPTRPPARRPKSKCPLHPRRPEEEGVARAPTPRKRS